MKVYQFVFNNDNSSYCKFKVLVNDEKYILDPYRIKSYDDFLRKKIQVNNYCVRELGELEVKKYAIIHKNYVVLYCQLFIDC